MPGIEVGDKFRKKGCIVIIHYYDNGDALVMNEGKPDYQWIIQREVFEKNYERAIK